MNSAPKQYPPFVMAEERAARSVFVGNIPYEATEEQLKEIFCQAGPVVSFRLVYDRETGKPKGYGFCEYQDLETAQSAMRNLNNHDFNGRPLRVGVAAGEQTKDENRAMQQALGGPAAESPYGEPVEPEKAPEAVARAVASLPPEQMFELMKQMKMCIQNNPNEARNMLLQNPQLAYALLQAQIVMKIVDPQVALAMLHRQTEQIPPMMPSSSPAQLPQQAQAPAMSSGPGPGPMQSSQAPLPSSVAVGGPTSAPGPRLPAPSALLGPPNIMVGPGTDFGPGGPPRAGILGDMPFPERHDQPSLDHPDLRPPVDHRDVGLMMDRRNMGLPMDRPNLPGLMDPREPGPPVDQRELGPLMDRRDGPLSRHDVGPFPPRPPMDLRDLGPGHLGPPMERRDLGPHADRREFERQDFGPPMVRHDPGSAPNPRDTGPMMERPFPPDMRAMDHRDIPVERRDFGSRGPEPAGRGLPGLVGDPRGPPRPEMMGRSPRMDEQGMDMAPRMRPPLETRPDLGRGGPLGPRPNFGPGLGRGVRPEGEIGLGPRMDMGPALGPRMDMLPAGPRMDLGPRGPGPVTDVRDPRQAADPRRMAAANAGVRPSGPPSTVADCPASQDQEKAALIMQVLQLSDEQIAQLPQDQRQSIMILKDQLARSSS